MKIWCTVEVHSYTDTGCLLLHIVWKGITRRVALRVLLKICLALVVWPRPGVVKLVAATCITFTVRVPVNFIQFGHVLRAGSSWGGGA